MNPFLLLGAPLVAISVAGLALAGRLAALGTGRGAQGLRRSAFVDGLPGLGLVAYALTR